MRRVWIAVIVMLFMLASATTVLAQQRTHIVQPGETLYRIALRYNVTVEQLAAVNGITNPSRIYVGQVLIIPGGTGADSVTGTTTYTVVRGDTLYSIARRFDTTVDRLVALNGLTNPSMLVVGQVLIVPLQTTAQPTTAPTVTPTLTTQPATPVSTTPPGTALTPIVPSATATPTRIPATATLTVTPTPSPQGPLTYTVQPGDTLYRIALRFGTSVQQIALLNNLANWDLIYPGQVLILRPGATPTAVPATSTATRQPTATVTVPPTATLTATPVKTATPTPATPTATRDPNAILTPTPIVPLTPIPANAPNLLTNPGFEGQTRRVLFDGVNVFEGWEPYYCDEPYTDSKCPALRLGFGNPEGLTMGRPEYASTTVTSRVHGGATAQQWTCRYSACRAGVFQTIDTVPGALCEAGAYVQSLSTNGTGLTSDVATRDDRDNVTWLLRVDLSGGTFAFAENDDDLLISRGFGYADGVYDQYVKISYTFAATGSRTTIYFENLRLWPFAKNVSYLDDAYVRCSASPGGN